MLIFSVKQKQMENMTGQASKPLDGIKVVAVMSAPATKLDIPANLGSCVTVYGDGALKQRVLRALELSGVPFVDGGCALEIIHVVMEENLTDEDVGKKESGVTLTPKIDFGNKSEWKMKCSQYVGHVNDYFAKIVKPEIGLLFSGATMQNIYQLITSGMVTTGKGKTLMKMNEAAFMMLLYGLVMPKRAAGPIALGTGVALASAAYLVTMSFAF